MGWSGTRKTRPETVIIQPDPKLNPQVPETQSTKPEMMRYKKPDSTRYPNPTRPSHRNSGPQVKPTPKPNPRVPELLPETPGTKPEMMRYEKPDWPNTRTLKPNPTQPQEFWSSGKTRPETKSAGTQIITRNPKYKTRNDALWKTRPELSNPTREKSGTSRD